MPRQRIRQAWNTWAARVLKGVRLLQALGENLWHATSKVRLPLPGARLPARMTVVRLESGALLLHSPIAIDDVLGQELSALGEVSIVVAPSASHYLFASAALARFPTARCFAADGISAKAPTLRLSGSIRELARELAGEVECFEILGMPKLNEWVFWHRVSNALIVTDLVFNVTEPEGFTTPWILRAAGTHRRLAVSRLLVTLIADRAAFLASVRPLLDTRFDLLLMAHGDVVRERAPEKWHAALVERFPELTR